jgi:low temperature requirement protein LtrA
MVTSIIAIPIASLWGAAAVVNWPSRAALILIALTLEGLASALLASPMGEWCLRGAPRKAIDADNLVDRLQGFFIIVLGEGVYAIIVGGKWGSGISEEFGLGVESLFIYYTLFWFFFYGDQTKTYIHAMYRNRYTSILFQS